MTPGSLPPWPAGSVAHGPVVLGAFSPRDVPMAQELSTDPYVPLVGTLPANASLEQASDWVDRQRGRWAEGAGFSFGIAEASTDRAVGGAGLWLSALAHGRATAGYSVVPSAPGTRIRDGGADRADLVRVDHSGAAPDRALHRALEYRLDRYRRTGRLPARGPAAQPPGDRRAPPGHAALRQRQGRWLLAPSRTGGTGATRTRP